jgi:hypothetical protein
MLLTFDLAYLGRVICGLTIFRKAYGLEFTSEFGYRMAIFTPAIFLDALPILFVMIVHHYSYKRARESETVEAKADEMAASDV